METLEHIRDDSEALSFFADKLKSGGVVVVSVPSNKKEMKHRTHLRIYDRESLRELFSRHFIEEKIISYGFPFLMPSLSIYERMFHLFNRKEPHYQFGGIKRYRIYRKLIPIMVNILKTDRLFSRLNLGIGIIAKFRVRKWNR